MVITIIPNVHPATVIVPVQSVMFVTSRLDNASVAANLMVVSASGANTDISTIQSADVSGHLPMKHRLTITINLCHFDLLRL